MTSQRKLNMILLIDDNDADNFLHTIVIEEAQVCEQVIALNGGQKALDFLAQSVDDEHPCPDLIFLDINMPGMNGWEFIEQYEQLPQEQKGKMMVVMLTTSVNPDDRERARQYGAIDEFCNKPLTPDDLKMAIDRFHARHG